MKLSKSGHSTTTSTFLCKNLCVLCGVNFFNPRLLQKIGVNPWLAVSNHDRFNGFLIKVDWPGATDDSINVTKFTQTPQRGNQQSVANATPSFAFYYSSGSKEGFPRTLVSRETNYMAA